jgi:hypothetical protein
MRQKSIAYALMELVGVEFMIIKKIPTRAVKQIVKHGGGSLMLWSCLTAKGVGSLYKIEQTLNTVRYLGLLQEELYTTLIVFDFDFDLGEVIFQ